VRTDELGAPGFLHDRWSSLHPAFVGGPAWAELGPDLGRHGLEYVTAPLATGSSLPDGRTAIAPVDPEAFAAELDRLGETAGWNALFAAAGPQLPPLLGLLGAGLDGPQAEAALAGLLRDGREGALPFGQLLAGSAVDLVRRWFRTEELRSLAAPWPLHIGAGPEDPAGAGGRLPVAAGLLPAEPGPLGAAALPGPPARRGRRPQPRPRRRRAGRVRAPGRGRAPARAPVGRWHEPTAVDPTRAPEGRAVARLQVLDVPTPPAGTRPGPGTAPADGTPRPPRRSPTASSPKRSCTSPASPGSCWNAT
jgi:phytoene dehydrogenase-like protein